MASRINIQLVNDNIKMTGTQTDHGNR